MNNNRVKDTAKKKVTVPYFTQETQDAIYTFLYDGLNESERNTIYATKIKPVFNKLVENLIFIYGINNTEQDYTSLKHDCVVFLYENLHKFDFSKGSKAFSYFNIVAKNWLILQAKQTSKRTKYTVLYNDRNSTDEITKNNLLQEAVEPIETDVLQQEFFIVLLEEIELWKEKTKNTKEYLVLDAVHQLFKNIDNINIYDKKAIFLYLKEMTGMTTKQLCVNINKIRDKYTKFKKHYHKDIF